MVEDVAGPSAVTASVNFEIDGMNVNITTSVLTENIPVTNKISETGNKIEM